MANRQHRSGFLAAYRLDDAYTLKPLRSKGRPGIYAGYAADGNPILAKFWPRIPGSDDRDLEEIWRHELRQLHRLAGYPGATDCIAHLYDAGLDSQGFYLILAAGQRRPLRSVVARAKPGHWLLQPTQPGSRARIWRNLALLARGIESLHSQGLLHRNVDEWAVLTAGTETPDFQLTGFEWSMRVVGAESKLTSVRRGRSAEQDSFLRDWKMYGELAASLLGVKANRLADKAIPAHEVADHLSAEETLLLRSVSQVLPTTLMNGEFVIGRIDQIVRGLAAVVAQRSPRFHVALRLGRDTPLADSIRNASQGEIEIDDLVGQRAFVADDLNEGPMIIAIKPRDEDLRLVLRGKNLLYRLEEFRSQKGGELTWNYAYCQNTDRTAPAPANLIGSVVLEPASLQLLTLSEAYEQFPRTRGKLRSWDEWREHFLRETTPPSPQQVTHKALSLLQLLEALYAAADVFPVQIVPAATDGSPAAADECRLRVRTRPDHERDDLARALKLKPPAIRLGDLLEGDGVKPEGWILSESKSLGDRSPSDTEWRFRQIEREPDRPDTYVFTGPQPAPVFREAYLLTEGSVGEDVQFRRRLKALRALAEHNELLRMMADPRSRIIDSHDSFIEDESFAKLDDPKREALREIVSTLPLYLVQGPPGVGKTRLVRDLVRRRFLDEPMSRLLLTAQSNAAIDHLMDELDAVLGTVRNEDAPLIVRCGGKDGQEAPTKFDIGLQSRQLLAQLARSDLAKTLPSRLRDALSTLSTAASEREAPNQTVKQPDSSTVLGRPANQAVRAFEGAVARAANVVFATTNSGELERLIEERGQCDWSIVEEAAKATGSELVSPMLLSHRRLMIGDHKQLPSFASDQLIELLKHPEAVKEAVTVGEVFVGRTLRDATTDEVLDEVDDEGENNRDDFPRMCSEALRILTFFETAIEAEFDRQKRGHKGRPIAKKLTQQHRMHPDIAALVSRCFYKRELTTHDECAARFRTEQRPFTSTDTSRLPATPLVVISMPYVQATVHSRHGDSYPRWHNPAEVEAVQRVVSLLAPNSGCSGKPTLAILSPYSQQVSRLADAIRDVPALKYFAPPSHSGQLCHTVDSFQGSEADLVVVSLVRNNPHSAIRNALGFLTDSRRMNVLLSRARWQLVLVGSFTFLDEVVGAATSDEDRSAVDFLNEMLNGLHEGSQQGVVSVVSFDRLCGS